MINKHYTWVIIVIAVLIAVFYLWNAAINHPTKESLNIEAVEPVIESVEYEAPTSAKEIVEEYADLFPPEVQEVLEEECPSFLERCPVEIRQCLKERNAFNRFHILFEPYSPEREQLLQEIADCYIDHRLVP